MKATSGGLRAFDKAVRAKGSIHGACSELMYEDGRSAEDRERIGAFRSSVGGRSIHEFDEDGCDRVRREIVAEATAFLAGYGIEDTVNGWRYASPRGPGDPARAFALDLPAARPARSPG